MIKKYEMRLLASDMFNVLRWWRMSIDQNVGNEAQRFEKVKIGVFCYV